MTSITPPSGWRCSVAATTALVMISACANQELAKPEAHEIGARIALSTPPDGEGTLGAAPSGTVRNNAAPIVEAVTSSGSLAGIRSFLYERGALYQLRAAVGAPSTIALQAGETLVSYALGDGELWIVNAAHADDQTHLLIEPTRADLSTHLLINTDRRSYLVKATSRQGNQPGDALAWSYPHERAVEVIDAVSAKGSDVALPKPLEPAISALSQSEQFTASPASPLLATRACRLCRDPDDHGDNDHGRDHDRGGHQSMR